MRQQFDYFEYGPNSDRERIRLAAVMLRGQALEWWQTRVDEPASWDAMLAALRTEFQPIDNAINARNKLLALKQGAGGAAEYVSAYRRLMIAVPAISAAIRLNTPSAVVDVPNTRNTALSANGQPGGQ